MSTGLRLHRDIEYARVGQRALCLDLRLPPCPTGLLPLVIWIHGGGWRKGTKDAPMALPLLEHGYALASIDYRLSSEAIFPAQIHDCKAAVRFLRAHALDYGINPDRFGAWGDSAGGHLAALLGTSGHVAALEGDLGHAGVSSRVQAVADWYGPTDFLAMGGWHEDADSPESLLIGGVIRKHPERCAVANPITHIRPDNPPFLIMHGDRDTTVPINQSELLYQAMRRAGVDVSFEKQIGEGHGFKNPVVYSRVREFFDRHLKRG
jgi:acetyl esterase/lipase